MNTILVVDDEPAILELLLMLLDDEGYHAVSAGDGAAALDHLAGTAVALVITDVMMPHMDGVGLIRAMRARVSLRDVPVILLSAATRPCLDGLSPCVFLPKPFEVATLLDHVRHAMDHQRA